jgi:hypothetical protein
VCVSLRAGQSPSVLTLDGLPSRNALRVSAEPPTAQAAAPTVFTFSLARPEAEASVTAVLVEDDGHETPAGGGPLSAPVTVRPAAATPGAHWLRIDVKRGTAAETPRWYHYVIAP